MCKAMIAFIIFLLPVLNGCKKNSAKEAEAKTGFAEFLIPAGKHESTTNVHKAVNLTEMKFVAKFDSSAIYTTTDPVNQYDINKLYGFADNNQHHLLFSARFGWRWSDKSLRLFGYVYNDGVRSFKELGTVKIGEEYNCILTISSSAYLFYLNGKVDSLPRTSTTPTAVGYQLYPYFGGDETAPHDIRIWIKEEK